jgi:hypothetical protein
MGRGLSVYPVRLGPESSAMTNEREEVLPPFWGLTKRIGSLSP